MHKHKYNNTGHIERRSISIYSFQKISEVFSISKLRCECKSQPLLHIDIERSFNDSDMYILKFHNKERIIMDVNKLIRFSWHHRWLILKWWKKCVRVCTCTLDFCFGLSFQVFRIKVMTKVNRRQKFYRCVCVCVFDIRFAFVGNLNNTCYRMALLHPFFQRVKHVRIRAHCAHTHTDTHTYSY